MAALATLALAGCADASTLRAAQQSPLPLAGTWRPGLFVTGYGPQGLGPASTTATVTGGGGSASVSAAPTSGAGARAQAILESVGFRAADFASGYTVAPTSDGTSLAVPTLDFCAKDFPSEDAREARREVVLVDPQGKALGVYGEQVLYTTPAMAASALVELRAAVRSCSPTEALTVNGHSLLVRPAEPGALDASGWVPASQRVLLSDIVTDSTAGSQGRYLSLYQVRGKVLSALYFAHGSGDAFSAADRRNLSAVGALVARRLAALTPSDVGAR